MLRFILRRVLSILVSMLVISLLAFAIIQLPPGDFVTSYAASMQAAGVPLDDSDLQALRDQYGLDQGFFVQYAIWIGNVLQGDFGTSLEWKQPVSELVWERMGLSTIIELSAILVMWLVALPIGIYSAIRKYSLGDYVATLFGFIGLAIPNFLLALLLMYVTFRSTGHLLGGLFSSEYMDAPWSLARLWDFLTHAWAPVLVLATAGTAHLIRVLRANLLDELHRPYVSAARARGLNETAVILRYPVRIAINPLLSTLGFLLPVMISSSVVVSVVMTLPTPGPLLLRSLLSQDTYLAGAFFLLMGGLTLIGTLISDLLLAWADPRIRLQ